MRETDVTLLCFHFGAGREPFPNGLIAAAMLNAHDVSGIRWQSCLLIGGRGVVAQLLLLMQAAKPRQRDE